MSRLFIQTRGHGDTPVVLVHGWAMHGGIFEPLIDALESQCTMHVVDLPGHGRSRDCSVPLQPAACVRAIAEATPPAIWLGWSMGGLFALHAALQMPGQVQALAMLCSSPCFVRKRGWKHAVSSEIFDQFAADLDDGFRATLERFLALEALGSDRAREEVRQLRARMFAHGDPDAQALKQGLHLLQDSDFRSRLPALSQPSVWLSGARDRLLPWQAMQWSARQCEGTFIDIPHAGHAPFIGFTTAVREALQPLLDTCTS